MKVACPTYMVSAVLFSPDDSYLEKIAADTKDDEMKEQRQNLREFVYDFFLFKFGLQMYAEIHLYMLLKTLEHRNLVRAPLLVDNSTVVHCSLFVSHYSHMRGSYPIIYRGNLEWDI